MNLKDDKWMELDEALERMRLVWKEMGRKEEGKCEEGKNDVSGES